MKHFDCIPIILSRCNQNSLDEALLSSSQEGYLELLQLFLQNKTKRMGSQLQKCLPNQQMSEEDSNNSNQKPLNSTQTQIEEDDEVWQDFEAKQPVTSTKNEKKDSASLAPNNNEQTSKKLESANSSTTAEESQSPAPSSRQQPPSTTTSPQSNNNNTTTSVSSQEGSSKEKGQQDEKDFFSDMTPVYKAPPKIDKPSQPVSSSKPSNSRLALKDNKEEAASWGDEEEVL